MYTNGDVYEGEWFDDEMAGQGTMVYGNQNKEEGSFHPKYVGTWRNNLREGYGVMVIRLLTAIYF